MPEESIPESITSHREGVPLTPLAARPIVRWLFECTFQWRRKKLAAEVERIHTQYGGVRGEQDPLAVIKKTLQHLAEEGIVESVPNGFGLWRRTGIATSQELPRVAGSIQPLPDSEDENDLEVLDEIGEGNESVYLYFNPNDRRLAELEGRDEWECKVGKTESAVTERVLDQGVKTALSHAPIIGLVIKTPDSTAVERALHASLRLADQTVEDSLGTEWFMTSPEKVKQWYQTFGSALGSLRKREMDQPTT